MSIIWVTYNPEESEHCAFDFSYLTALVPSHPLFPHPDRVVPTLEVEVSVLLATSIDVLLRFSYKIGPNPVVALHFWMPLLRERELEHENPIFSVLIKIQHKTDTSFGVEELNRRKRKVNFRELNLLNDCVIDVKVSEVINSNKIPNSQTECRPLCGVAEKLNPTVSNVPVATIDVFPDSYGSMRN